MNAREFQAQTREVLERTLNQLQAATLLVAQLESQVSEAGRAVQGLTQIIEQYVSVQLTENNELLAAQGEEDSSESPRFDEGGSSEII